MTTRERPLRVCVDTTSELVSAGVRTVLARRSGSVQLVPGPWSPSRVVDLVLVDASRVTRVGPSGIRRLSPAGAARVVVVGWLPAADGQQLARTVGADGFVPLTLGAGDFVDHVVAVHRGRTDEVGTAGAEDAPGRRVSGREAEVLELICQGLGNQEIADRLFLSINTVKTYVRTAYRKIGVTTRPQAVVWGLTGESTTR